MKKIACIFVAFFAIGCTTTITTRTIIQPFNGKIDQETVFDAAITVLSKYGFIISMANERLMLIRTEWRDATSGLDKAATILSALGSGPATSYGTTMAIQIDINENGYIVTPQLQSSKSTMWGSQTGRVSYPKSDSNEGKLVSKIVEEINSLAEIQKEYVWHEETVTVGP